MTIGFVTDFKQQRTIPCALMLGISLLKAYFIASEFLDLLNHKRDFFILIIYPISVLLLRIMNRLQLTTEDLERVRGGGFFITYTSLFTEV